MAMRILHVINNLPVGGAERFLVVLADAQRRRGLQVQVATLTGGAPLEAELSRRGIRCTAAGVSVLNDPRSIPRLRALMKEVRPDVVHTHLFYADVFGTVAARLARVPAVVRTEHSTERTAHSLRRRWGMRAAVQWTDRTITVSDAVARALTARHPGSAPRIVTIPNGIELAEWETAEPLDRSVLGVPATGVLIGAVGRLETEKAHDVLLDALARLPASGWHACIAGGGAKRARLEARAAECGIAGRVHWLGTRRDIPRVLKTLDIYVQPSRYEGLSMALLEAMAAGRACVVSAIPELTGPLAETGRSFAAGDAAALAGELAALVADPDLRHRLGKRAQAAARTFSIDRTAALYESVYAEILAARGAAQR